MSVFVATLLTTLCAGTEIDPPPPSQAEPTLVRTTSPRSREKSERRFSVWLGPRGAGRFGNGGAGGGGAGAVGGAVRLFRGLWIAGELAEGFYTGPDETLGQIRFGARYELWTPRVRPFIFLGGDHAHQQTWENATQEPLLTVVGASDNLEHRTGATAAIGLKIPLSTRKRGFLRFFSIMPQVDFTYYVDTKPNPALLSGSLLLAATF
jgi:hypothetical protein